MSPVALHTAVISMPDFVPSMNELNILGLAPAFFAVSSLHPKYFQTVSGVDS